MGRYDPELGTISGSFKQRGMEFSFSVALAEEGAREKDLLEKLDGLEEFLTALMKEWRVAGMAIGIVKNGELVFAEGYGKRDLERGLAVTPETVFAIGSATKGFTAMALGMLVDEGKLDWDAPIREYMPDLRLWDEYATDHVTARDLLTHRTGLPRHDRVWLLSDHSRGEIYSSLRHLEPSTELRANFQYNNLMYMVAGILAGRLSSSTWEEVVRERIFEPLAMTSSSFAVEGLEASSNHARGYRFVPDGESGEDGRLVPAEIQDTKEIGPAGSINSSVQDMAAWLNLHLQGGGSKGESLISAGQLAQMHTPQIPIPAPIGFDELSMPCYGMGWYTMLYRGDFSISHEGNVPGYSTQIFLLPGKGIGVAVLANATMTNLPKVAAWNIVDRLLGSDPLEWARLLGPAAVPFGVGAAPAVDPLRVSDTRPSHSLDDYTGTYSHPAYGAADITMTEDGQLHLTGNDGTDLCLDHFHYDVFSLSGQKMGLKMTFNTDLRGMVSSFSIPLEPSVSPIVFVRKPDNPLDDPEFIEKVVGTYDLMGMETVFRMSDHGTLILTVPGQPAYEYLPVGGLEFQAKGWDASFARFELDPSGGPTKVLLIEPHGNYWATRR
jgi:CubicO group peptidase (beta-lactamase class C family)